MICYKYDLDSTAIHLCLTEVINYVVIISYIVASYMYMTFRNCWDAYVILIILLCVRIQADFSVIPGAYPKS